MFPNLKWLRLTPDRPGRGGSKTGIHSFQQAPVNDTYSLTGAHVYRGYWRRDFDSTAYPVPQTADAGSFGIGAIHGYVYPSLTDPSAQPSVTVIGQTLPNIAANPTHFWDFTHGTVRSSRPAITGAGYIPAVFRNINQRCFGGDGLAEAVIMDDRTPAIHAQPNQPLGIGTPSQPLSLNSAGNVGQWGTGYIHYASYFLNHPDPNNQLSTCIVGDTIAATPVNSVVGTSGWNGFPTVFGGSYVLTTNGVTSNTTTFAATGTISIDPAVNPSLVNLSGATWPLWQQYAGLAINFNGQSYVILTHGYTGDTTPNWDINGVPAPYAGNILPDTVLYILGTYDGPKLTNVPYTITGCQVTLDPTLDPNPPHHPIHISLASMLNGANPLGYSQSTNSRLVQVAVNCARANGYFRNLGNISLGPESANGDTGGSIQSITDAGMADGKKMLTSASNPFTLGDVGAPMFVDGAGAGGITLNTTIAAFNTVGNVRLGDPNISGGVIAGANAWWGAEPVISDGAITLPVTLNSASGPFVSGDVGQPIVVEGAGFGGVALITTIATYVSSTKVTLTAAATIAVTNARVWWRGISVDTHAGPTYAYAWYDPETGHCSNISPMFQVPRPSNIGQFTDFANITPFFQIDPGYISYPDGASQTTPTNDGIRFSHILFFRTLSTPGSSTLYPIGSLMPFVGKVHPGLPSTRGSWGPNTYKGWSGLPNNYVYAPSNLGPTYWYDFSTDSDLLLSGGFRAPQFTNEKPMALLRGGITQPGKPVHMEYWDRRTWLVNTQEPDKIVFSCDEAQCPLGVPEESFPPTNFLRLPAVDGRVLGMRTIGDMLLITTERWAYIVAGNNESNYRLMKVSSSMPGVGTYQVDEFPTYSGTEGEPTTVFYIGRDRIIYQWTVGAQAIPISTAVQNYFDAALSTPPSNPLSTYQLSRLHCVSAWGRRLVIVYPYLSTNSKFMVYDIDNQVWSQSQTNDTNGSVVLNGQFAFTTIYGLNVPVNEIVAFYSPAQTTVIVRSWLRDDTTTCSAPMFLETFPMNFDGKKTRKQVVMVNLHATTGTYQLTTVVGESNAPSNVHVATFTPYTDLLDSIYGPAPVVPVDGATVTDTVVLAGALAADGTPIVAYRTLFAILRSDNVPANIYAIDIGYVDIEDPGDGDA